MKQILNKLEYIPRQNQIPPNSLLLPLSLKNNNNNKKKKQLFIKLE